MRNRWFMFALVAMSMIAIVTLEVIGDREPRLTMADRRKLDAFAEFCTGTRMTLDVDIRKLEGDNAQWKQYATTWIEDDIARHGFTSVYACLGENTPTRQRATADVGLGEPLSIPERARAWRDALVRAGY